MHTDMENGRPYVFTFHMSKFDIKIINEKLEELFNKLESAAKTYVALSIFLREVETGD